MSPADKAFIVILTLIVTSCTANDAIDSYFELENYKLRTENLKAAAGCPQPAKFIPGTDPVTEE